ncbi:MAG: hypothetical protein WCO45_04810 [Pseudanabaena sp. ELA607]
MAEQDPQNKQTALENVTAGGDVNANISQEIHHEPNKLAEKIGIAVLMSGDSIEAKESQGFVDKPQGDVEQQFGDRTVANTDGGDYARGDIDKRNITINNTLNIITGSSGTQSQSQLIEELSQIMAGGLNLDAASIQAAYQAALPPDADLYSVQADNRISELADRRALGEFINIIIAENPTLSEPDRAQLRNFMNRYGLKPKDKAPKKFINIALTPFLIIAIKKEDFQGVIKFSVNAWLIPDDSLKDLSKFVTLKINVDLNAEIINGLWTRDNITALVKDLLKQSYDYLSGACYSSADFTVEFFLPYDCLYAEVDRLKVIPDLIDDDEFYPLGNEYKVLVRSYEREHVTFSISNYA